MISTEKQVLTIGISWILGRAKCLFFGIDFWESWKPVWQRGFPFCDLRFGECLKQASDRESTGGLFFLLCCPRLTLWLTIAEHQTKRIEASSGWLVKQAWICGPVQAGYRMALKQTKNTEETEPTTGYNCREIVCLFNRKQNKLWQIAVLSWRSRALKIICSLHAWWVYNTLTKATK